jgi:hypothetical protein
MQTASLAKNGMHGKKHLQDVLSRIATNWSNGVEG